MGGRGKGGKGGKERKRRVGGRGQKMGRREDRREGERKNVAGREKGWEGFSLRPPRHLSGSSFRAGVLWPSLDSCWSFVGVMVRAELDAAPSPPPLLEYVFDRLVPADTTSAKWRHPSASGGSGAPATDTCAGTSDFRCARVGLVGETGCVSYRGETAPAGGCGVAGASGTGGAGCRPGRPDAADIKRE